MISKLPLVGSATVYLALATVGFAGSSLQEALDLDTQSLAVSASAWTCETAGSHDGIDVAMSPPIGDDQSAGFEVTIVGPDTVSFWWKVSSEQDYDFLRVTVGSTTLEISGDTAWAQEVIDIPVGSQAIRWEYVKDEDASQGQDRGWIDEIRFASKAAPVIAYPSKMGVYVGQPITILPTDPDFATSFALGDGAPSWLSINETTGAITGIPPGLGDLSITVTGQSSSGSSLPATIAIQTAELGPGLESIATGWHWQGDQPWFTQTSHTHDGIDALRSGSIDHNESTELHVPVVGPAIIRFWWRVDSEGSKDILSFRIDGLLGKDLAGEDTEIDDLTTWEQRVVTVPLGHHTISWHYTKDFAETEGEDAAWLDEVEIIDSGDPDGDGLPSIVEAILGLEWKHPSTDTLQLPTETGGQLSWQIAKGANIEGIDTIIEISYDLETWSSAPLEILNDTASQLSVREHSTSASPSKFIRLRAKVAE